MCNKNSPPPHDVHTKNTTSSASVSTRKSKRNRKKTSVSTTLKPSRKTRTKTRKPKFLSLLHLELSRDHTPPQMAVDDHHQHQQQLNLFPLHPENLMEDKDNQLYDNVSLLFNAADNANATLNGLLGNDSDRIKDSPTTTTTTTSEAGQPTTTTSTVTGLTYGYSAGVDSSSLVRTAMKGKERDTGEEKWVSYSEVVEKKEIDEVSSCVGGGGVNDDDGDDEDDAWSGQKKVNGNGTLLALKLDYEQILNAWSDKGPLYIEGESPQTVPDLHDCGNVPMDAWGGALRVPEMASTNVCSLKIKEEFSGNEDWRRGHREASVLRYKEKRQSRLFSKCIRYEVRKLNAEKRPRLKGRFVKRN